MPRVLSCIVLFWLGALGAAQAGAPENYLARREPVAAREVADPARLTDGGAAPEGSGWQSAAAAPWHSARAYVVYDLGAVREIGCVWLQADNNDLYILQGSLDGANFQPLWAAPSVSGQGLRLRWSRLRAQARYLGLSAEGGDGRYAVSELGAAAECPAMGPERFFKRAWLLNPSQRAQAWLGFAVAMLSVCLVLHRRLPRPAEWLCWALSAAAALWAAWQYAQLYPFFKEEPALRAALAWLAALIALREGFAQSGREPSPRLMTGWLTAFAMLAIGCYYHFGMPQFWDQAKGRRTLVHTFDMRHYFPVAKYFPELRFDGLYLASLAAYLDNTPGAALDRMGAVRLRDLKTSEMRYAPEVADELAQVRARFTPVRWGEFRRDMHYLQRTMGAADYLGSMQDHGGNATPAWILGAWLLFRELPANEWTLSLAALIDPALIALLLVAVYRSFGLRVMLYTAILFGATDFYNFGSNLMGSTLRQDWLVALGLGACALKTRRWVLGGALLAYAGLIRAFPAMATFFLALPVLWWGVDRLRARHRLRWADLWTEQAPALRAGLGAAATVVLFVIATSVLFGWQGAWGNWIEKIEIHATGPSVNNVGLRNVMSYDPDLAAKHVMRRDHPEPWIEWQRTQQETYAARRPVTYAVLAAALLLAGLACRGRELHQTALLSLLVIPFLFYPSNYYCHFIFLLPLALAGGRAQPGAFGFGIGVLCALCFGQYFTLFERWSDLCYTYQSFMLLAACLLLLLPLAWQGWRNLRNSAAA